MRFSTLSALEYAAPTSRYLLICKATHVACPAGPNSWELLPGYRGSSKDFENYPSCPSTNVVFRVV